MPVLLNRPVSSTWRHSVATCLAAGLVAVAAALGALAAGSTSPAVAASDNAAPGKLMLVLDSSGSMKENDGAGQRKIDAAKQALRKVVDALPADQPVGLRVFGATVFSKDDAGACTDSQLKVPVGTDNHAELLRAVGGYKPYGETPIGYALQQAGADLGTSGKRSIVLVSDGVPTCKPDPCRVAKQLTKDGIDLRIDVVGLDVDDKAREALRCIAENGNGTYYDVSNAKDFASSLIKVATRAARPYTTIGKQVTPGTSAADAPTLAPGDWLARTAGNVDQYFKLARSETGSTLMFSASTRAPEGTPMNSAEITAPDGTLCSASGGSQVIGTYLLDAVGGSAAPVNGFGDPDPDRACATADHVLVKFHYGDSHVGVPIEIRVTELPPVQNLEELPEPAKAPFRAPRARAAEVVQGGTSFDDAPSVGAGTYSDNIVQGETLTYRVHLDWGQSLSLAAKFPAVDDAHADAVAGGPFGKLAVFSPARLPVAPADSGGTVQSQGIYRNGAELTTSAGPVAFRNSTSTGDTGANMAGDYYVTVYLDREQAGRSIPIPFKLLVGVHGSAKSGPDFASDPTAATSAATGDEDGGDEARVTSGSADSDGASPLGPILGGLGVVALIAAGVVFWRSRLSTPTPGE